MRAFKITWEVRSSDIRHGMTYFIKGEDLDDALRLAGWNQLMMEGAEVEEMDASEILRVKLVGYSPSRLREWTDQHKYTVFEVVIKRTGGYDVDMAPLGVPGKFSFMGEEEVIATTDPVSAYCK